MKGKRYRLILYILTTGFILLALAAESVYFSDFEYRFRTRMVNKILASKETILGECLDDMKPVLARENHHGSNSENDLFSKAEKNRITILEYFDNKLAYWSDNEFEVPTVYVDSLFNKPMVFLQNGWFLTKTIMAGNEKIIGLLRIHTDYAFANNIIKSGFDEFFRMPSDVGFSTDKKASEFHISDKEGNFLFSLSFPVAKGNTGYIYIPLCLWTGAFILLILLAFELVKYLVSKDKNIAGIVSSFLVLSTIYLVLLLTGKPLSIHHTELFSPYRFTMNGFIPSLGHLLVLGILTSSFAAVWFRHFPLKDQEEQTGAGPLIRFSLLLIIGAILFCVFHQVFRKLVSTSNINFETYKALDLNIFSAAGFVSVFLFLLIPVFYTVRILKAGKGLRARTVIFALIISLVVPFLFFFIEPGTLAVVALFYCVLVLSIWIAMRRSMGVFNLTVIYSIISGLYFLYFITILSENKTTENIKIQAVSFSTENDPEAEHMLLDLWPDIAADSTLAGMMKAEFFNKETYDTISNYIQDTYFTGFWKNYHFNIVLCHNDQQLQINTGPEHTQNCFSFFDDRIKRNGHKLTSTNFYFIDNQGGRSYYLCRSYYPSVKHSLNGLFIELYSDVNIFQPGYSELLLDKKYHGYAGLKDYSFAKYINGEMVLRTGDFPYDKTDAEYIEKSGDYRLFDSDGYEHVLYKNGNATVLISRPNLSAGDIIISFAYLFAFILLFSNLIILLVRRPAIRAGTTFNFRQKLQLSYIGILLFSFILIGIVVAYITIVQYKSKHYENIKEKLNSVYLELDSKLSNESVLTPEWRGAGYSSLNELLIKLSNIFNTDINIYNLNGFLISTSRQEIFNRDLTSQRINNLAFNNLKHLGKSEFYQTEKIGKLEYLSAYIPYFNNENKVIAYLNLPYFRMQSVLAKEISNLIVAVINFTLLLIVITMSLAVFISGRLTAPLSMLSKGLATVGVGKKSEQLTYIGNDEIGELVKQYNRMVDEIEESTHKLANSEREYAWREMAKQIAHEIKNPLTPMKLNVQQLFKSWNDKVPDFSKLLERFTKNQIEYIDNLSSIASAFSTFAKMPVTNPVEVNILDHIRITLELFKNTDNVVFDVVWPPETKIVVYADKEQLNGVFSNLIKNGIQSIPADRTGTIRISSAVKDDKVIISITDNGSGVPEELRINLFTPNFTTKSSGMGLGLSIVKKYIESAGGKIWFEPDLIQGSVFSFELPVMFTVEKHDSSNRAK
jgi:two-component system, NtrC family, nitrogen regulation sensor histidine kinase NtrY